MASSASGGAADLEFNDTPEADGVSNHLSKPFRFKSTSQRSKAEQPRNSPSLPYRRHHHSSHRRSKRRKVSTSKIDVPPASDDTVQNLPPDVAFRESLFDALGDDEGAAFWEGVYGQPIHNYPNTYENEKTGQLEHMSDEEYAQYVRRKMWERSQEGIEAAREEKRRKREQARWRHKDKENTQNSADSSKDAFMFELEVEQSLKRGEQRRERKYWNGLWKDYLRRWKDLQELAQNRKDTQDESEHIFLRNKIAWPVESGKRKDVTAENIERFVTLGTKYSVGTQPGKDGLAEALKVERIRWHPDKIQQRYGSMNIDAETTQSVTAVFQVLDRMWSEKRNTG